MDQEVLKKFEEQEVKLDKIWKSVETTRKYFLWTLITTAVMFVLPLIALLFVIPKFTSIYTTGLNF